MTDVRCNPDPRTTAVHLGAVMGQVLKKIYQAVQGAEIFYAPVRSMLDSIGFYLFFQDRRFYRKKAGLDEEYAQRILEEEGRKRCDRKNREQKATPP